jgi:hypothetical protein
MNDSEQEILQKHLAQFLIQDVFNTIAEEDILKIGGPNVWEHKGKLLSAEQVKALKSEAQIFKSSALWQVLKSELRWNAHQQGFIKAQGAADQIAGKVLYYLTDVIDTKLKRMSE